MSTSLESGCPDDIHSWIQAAQAGPESVAARLEGLVRTRLTPAQQQAVFAWLPDSEALCAAFSSSLAHAGPLAGVPYALKDLYHLAGVPTGAGSSFLAECQPVPTAQGRLPARLSELGAVCAGKTQLHEFAYGLTGENPFFGNCDNPRHPGRTTGGSSSGSAAAVAAGIVPFAIGTDTGGSVRVPAAFCGLYGYRMEPGHPWITDAFSLAPSCDTAGWFTRSGENLGFLNHLLLGGKRLGRAPRGLSLSFGRLEPEVTAAFQEHAGRLAPHADALSANQLLSAFQASSETYSVLTSAEAAEVHKAWLDPFKSRYSPTVWDRIDRGRRWSDAELIKAASHRQFLRDTLVSYFLSYDFLVLPATPCPALLHAACPGFDRTRVLELTAPASLAGLPVLSLPLPLANGLSGGLQVILPKSENGTAAALLETFRATAAKG